MSRKRGRTNPQTVDFAFLPGKRFSRRIEAFDRYKWFDVVTFRFLHQGSLRNNLRDLRSDRASGWLYAHLTTANILAG